MPIHSELLRRFLALVAARGDARTLGFIAEAGPMPPRALEPRPLTCLEHLPRAAELASQDARRLASFLEQHAASLHWGQTYGEADLGRRFLDNYGWVEVFGTRGHFASDAVAGGLLILGPHTLYPDHHHQAEEIYIPLTGGTEWRMGAGGFVPRAAGEVIHHPSGVNHAMRTGAGPLLALYLWRGGPLAAKSTLAGSPPGGGAA